MKVKPTFEAHLVMKDVQLPKGGEWTLRFRGWCFLQIRSGVAYWQGTAKALELAPGTSLILSDEVRGSLRASLLNEVVVDYFSMDPSKLAGLLTLSDQQFLQRAASRDQVSVRVIPSAHPVSQRLKNFC
jgi:hypothetical protein